jgi:uncharacterized protein YndB with AHSA1/START domain
MSNPQEEEMAKSKTRKVKKSVVVQTTPELAFEALTAASELREWCSDEAWTEVRPGGRYALRWNSGYQAEGQFVKVDSPRGATLTWRGTGEPGKTRVKFRVKPGDEGVQVSITHSSFGPGKKWDAAVEASEKGWTAGLENLKSVLETGLDLRLARRPFMGILLDQLTPERAEKEGIAAEAGIYVTGTVKGSGAEVAGLGNGDVIVALGGQETPGFQELGAALGAHQTGDTVDVDLVRGQARETVQVTLGQRPAPGVPDTASELADRLAGLHQEVNAALQAALEGVSDEEASQSPAEGEWSVKQVLAHLTDGERGFHQVASNIAVIGWHDAEGFYPDQFPGRLDAVLAVTPTLQGLVDRFLTDEAETVAVLRGLPETTLAHKARYRRVGQFALSAPDHTREHIEQIKRTIEAVRY